MITNRMLKLMDQILKHKLELNTDLLHEFNQIEARTSDFTLSFGLTIKRIKLINKQLRKKNLEERQLKDIQTNPSPI